MRIDLALCRLRFVKTRADAQRLVRAGHIRCNGTRIERASHAVKAGDVLTLPLAGGVRTIRIAALPERRGPPAEARSHYRELDRTCESAIAGDLEPSFKGNSTP